METVIIGRSGEMVWLDETGESKIIWSADNEDEIEAAREMFEKLKKKGYVGYKVEGKKGEKGEVVREFDPMAERLIMAPPMKGG
jgi:beta-galactosidase/beta-glucuronidase